MCRIKSPRLARLVGLWLDEPSTAPEAVSAVPAIACLYREWQIAGRELERLARALTRRRTDNGLRSLEQACTSIRIAGGLLEIVEREHAAGRVGRMRTDLLAEIRPWLATARHELPAAAAHLCTLVADAAGRDRVTAALRLLEEEPAARAGGADAAQGADHLRRAKKHAQTEPS